MGPQGTDSCSAASRASRSCAAGRGANPPFWKCLPSCPTATRQGRPTSPASRVCLLGCSISATPAWRRSCATSARCGSRRRGFCSRFDRLRIFTGLSGHPNRRPEPRLRRDGYGGPGPVPGRREICVRAGLHCAPLAHRTAGTFETGTVRLSFSAMNHPWQLCALERALAEILE